MAPPSDSFDHALCGRNVLKWYDRHARSLPWRVAPAGRAAGILPDPYHVWLSEVMLQQTQAKTVAGYFTRFVRRWPDIGALAPAPEEAAEPAETTLPPGDSSATEGERV